MISNIRIAIVHEWLDSYAGSERVLEQMIRVLPHADLFSLVDFIPESDRGFLMGKPVTTTFLQKLPLARRRFRHYLPLMPLAVEQLDLSGYDLVVSSSHAFSKGVLTGPDQVHLCYCHSPIRYAWDLQHQYLAETGLTRGPKGTLVRALLHYIRMWDVRTANGVDSFIANSEFVARRIRKVYGRSSSVIYPPVRLEGFSVHEWKDDFYLAASRFVPYKKMGMIVDAFARMPDRKLVVIGEGPEFRKVLARATANVTLLGYQPHEVLREHMQRARAFVFAAEEDFGIAAVEAQVCGTPVIAYGKGGATETVVPGRTGLFFAQQTAESLCDALLRFEASRSDFDPVQIRAHAERFGEARFRQEFADFVAWAWENSQGRRGEPLGQRDALAHSGREFRG